MSSFKHLNTLKLQMRGSGGSPEMGLGPCLSIQSVRAGGSPMDTDSRSPRPEMYPGIVLLILPPLSRHLYVHRYG